MHCCLTSRCVYRQINSYQPPSGYLSIIWSASGGSARDLRRQQAQGVPGVGKKADVVADRSGVPLLYNLACLYRSLPLPEGKAYRLSRLSYPAPAPCRSGSKGEAPWSLQKERNPGARNLQTASILYFILEYKTGNWKNDVRRISGHLTNDTK